MKVFMVSILVLSGWVGGYLLGRPRTITIRKTEATKTTRLKALPGEPCSVVDSPDSWKIVCGLK
jgi:hypothetical protein